MSISPLASSPAQTPRQRRFPRYEVQCRARIRIGARQYAGYVHDISLAGARLRTISPIRKIGAVILRLPDLPPLRCELRWTDSYHAGVLFARALTRAELKGWIRSRASSQNMGQSIECEIVQAADEPDHAWEAAGNACEHAAGNDVSAAPHRASHGQLAPSPDCAIEAASLVGNHHFGSFSSGQDELRHYSMLLSHIGGFDEK